MFLDKVRKTIRRYRMFEHGDVVVAGVSGGVDSSVLLYVLHTLKEEYNLALIVAHLNHGLRGDEAERDYNFVEGLARELNLPFRGKTLRAGELKRDGESLQDMARRRRMEFLMEVAGEWEAKRIALGHNLDDQAETVMMRFIKGSGLRGLSGMEPIREPFVRPLIEVTRKEIERFAKERKIRYVFDSSNLDLSYLRNNIRFNLLPFIESNYNRGIKETLARTALILRGDDEYISEQAKLVFSDIVKESRKKYIAMDRTGLMGIHRALAVRIFMRCVEMLKGEGSDIYTTHIEAFFEIVNSTRPNLRVSLPHGLYLIREYDRILLSSVPPDEPEGFTAQLRIPGTTEIKEQGYVFKASVLKKIPSLDEKNTIETVAFFDYDLIPLPLRIRNFKPGDRIRPIGFKGTRKVKDIFIEKKIPLSERRSIPLLCTDGEVLWIVGIRQSERYKITDKTSRVLRVECRMSRKGDLSEFM